MDPDPDSDLYPDPDSDGIRIGAGFNGSLDPDSQSGSESGSRRAKITLKS